MARTGRAATWPLLTPLARRAVPFRRARATSGGSSMTIESFLAAAPKVELHLHLVGSASPATVAALAERQPDAGVPADVDRLTELFRFRDFPHFIEVYDAVTSLVTTAEDIAIVID